MKTPKFFPLYLGLIGSLFLMGFITTHFSPTHAQDESEFFEDPVVEPPHIENPVGEFFNQIDPTQEEPPGQENQFTDFNYCEFYSCPNPEDTGDNPFIDRDFTYGDVGGGCCSPFFDPNYFPDNSNPGDVLGWMNLNYFNFGSLFALPASLGITSNTNANTPGLEAKAETAIRTFSQVPVVSDGTL
jgi:hypothetical protein